jgi:O-antigen/teichoic acid export membrane protein
MGTTEKTSYSRILKHSSIYMFGIVLSRIISFIMLPIYTRYLSPGDYGVLELLTMTSDAISILIGMGLPSAIFRFYSEKETQEEKNRVISTALISGASLFFLVFSILFMNSGAFSRLVFGKDTYTTYFRVVFISMMFSSSIELPLVFLRAKARSFEFVILSSIKLAIQLSLNIYFVVYLGYGVIGVLYSTLIASVLLSVYLVITTFKSCGLGFSTGILKDLVRYGVPLIFSQLGAFVLTFSDRYFIQAYFNINQVGLYSLGYKFGTIVSSLLMGPFFQHWAIEMFEIDKKPDREQVFVNIFDAMFVLSMVLIFIESIFIKEAVKIISAPEYLLAYTIVPIICLAYYFSMLMYFVQVGILIKKQTRLIAYSTVIAAAVNIGLNFLLIPKYGMYGAGASALISFFVRFFVVYKWSQSLYPLPYRWGRLNMLIGYSVLLLLCSYFISIDSIVLGLVKDTVIVLIYLATIFVFWLRKGEREKILAIARKPREAFATLLSR